MSHNQLAYAVEDGTFEIRELKSSIKQLKSRVVQKIRHDLGDHDDTGYIFTDFTGKALRFVWSIIRNEEMSLKKFQNAFSHDHPKIFPKFQTRAKEIVSNVAKLKEF
jgi:hypothetical protein